MVPVSNGLPNFSSPVRLLFHSAFERLAFGTLSRERSHMFPASTLHACAVRSGRSGSHGGQWEEAKAAWISLFLSSNFVCFIKYCGIKVNASKEKPSRFLQVQLISVWLIRYNHCKLIKLTFFVPFTKNGIFKLTKCGLSLKVYVFYAV